jgi:hypothetical protein
MAVQKGDNRPFNQQWAGNEACDKVIKDYILKGTINKRRPVSTGWLFYGKNEVGGQKSEVKCGR